MSCFGFVLVAQQLSVLALPQEQGNQLDVPTCQVDTGVLLTGPTTKSYAGVANPAACCALCSTAAGCIAWSITNLTGAAGQQTCELKDSVGQQQLTPTATSGILGNASKFTTHYGNPYPNPPGTNATACQSDEIEFEMNGVRGSFCSPACSSDGSGQCPTDRPPAATAVPQCILHDSVGSGSHCALVCKSDAECGPGAHCVTKFDDAICVYPLDRSDFGSATILARLDAAEKSLETALQRLNETETALTDKIEHLAEMIEINVTQHLKGSMKMSTVNVPVGRCVVP